MKKLFTTCYNIKFVLRLSQSNIWHREVQQQPNLVFMSMLTPHPSPIITKSNSLTIKHDKRVVQNREGRFLFIKV